MGSNSDKDKAASGAWSINNMPNPPKGWGEWHRYKIFRVFADCEGPHPDWSIEVWADFPSPRWWVTAEHENDIGPSVTLEVFQPSDILPAIQKATGLLGGPFTAWLGS